MCVCAGELISWEKFVSSRSGDDRGAEEASNIEGARSPGSEASFLSSTAGMGQTRLPSDFVETLVRKVGGNRSAWAARQRVTWRRRASGTWSHSEKPMMGPHRETSLVESIQAEFTRAVEALVAPRFGPWVKGRRARGESGGPPVGRSWFFRQASMGASPGSAKR